MTEIKQGWYTDGVGTLYCYGKSPISGYYVVQGAGGTVFEHTGDELAYLGENPPEPEISAEMRGDTAISDNQAKKDRLESIATAALQGMLSSWDAVKLAQQHGTPGKEVREVLAQWSVSYAQALIAELDKQEGV